MNFRHFFTEGGSKSYENLNFEKKIRGVNSVSGKNLHDFEISYPAQDQDQDSLLVKCLNDNHSPGPVIRELVPSSHQRSELCNTILCIFSR